MKINGKTAPKRRIYIELTNRCNLQCSFCPYPGIKKRREDMEFSLVTSLLDDIQKNIEYRIVYFHNLGEPLLYGELEKVLVYCDKLKINYGITTNGLLLAKKLEILRNKNINQINISYQAVKKDLHEERGSRMSLDQYRVLVAKSIKSLLDDGFGGVIKIKLLTTNDKSKFKNRRFKNIEKLDELILEIDKFNFNLLGRGLREVQKRRISNLDINKHNRIQVIDNIFIETFPFLTWGNYSQNVWGAILGKCDGIIGQLVILSNGDIVPCCYDIDSDILMGNVKENKLSEILHSKKVKKIESGLSSKFIFNKRCRKCLGNFSLLANLKNQLDVFLEKQEITDSGEITIL